MIDDMVSLPANIHAEKVLIAAVMGDNRAFYEVTEGGLEAEDFYLDSHKRLWEVIAEMMAAGRSVDSVTILQELTRRKWLESIGGATYLMSMDEGMPRRPATSDYTRIVRDKSMA